MQPGVRDETFSPGKSDLTEGSYVIPYEQADFYTRLLEALPTLPGSRRVAVNDLPTRRWP